MPNILIRDVPDWLHHKLKVMATENGKTVSLVIAEALSDHFGRDPAAKESVLGFVKLDFYGDINPDEPCDWCEIPYEAGGGAFLCFRGDDKISAVVCGSCAASWHS